jgi:putative NADH-flavin reductase
MNKNINKICIFGAGGRTGIEVVKKAKISGYDVVAFVYHNTETRIFDNSVTVVQGDILNYNDVEDAVKGVDAVISVVGHIKNSNPLMQTKGIKNIINAMNNHGVKRLVSLTGTGVRISGDKPSFIDYLLNFFIKIIDPERIIDGKEHVKAIQNSNLDWTILRVLKLTKKSFTLEYNLTEHGPAELFSSRKKVAEIMVNLVSSQKYSHKMPISS